MIFANFLTSFFKLFITLIFHPITIFFTEGAQPRLAVRILEFRYLSCFDGSGKYHNKEKPLKHRADSDKVKLSFKHI